MVWPHYRPQQASIAPATIPAPVGGINALTGLAMMQPNDAIYTKNIDATLYGLKVRPGYQEYANGFTGDEVKTIIPYKGSLEDGTKDKLFACTSAGIFDISASTTTPTLDQAWVTTSSDAGWCHYEIFTNDAGTRILLVTDLANGVYQYDEATDAWSIPTLTGVTEANVVHFTIWKNRVWYVEKDTNNAWYTDIGTYSGTVTKFNFGNKFIYGGYLKSLHGWTLDSGVGPDDYIVALSSAGDVLVYGGTNPSSSATFGIIGAFYVGEFPNGRRVALKVGGDLYLLSTYGVLSAKDLLQGANPFTDEGSVSYKINPMLRSDIADYKDDLGWELTLLPDIARIVVTVPKQSNTDHKQYLYEMNLKAWSIWEFVPMTTVTTYKNEIYTGEGTQVHKVTGTLDNVTLAAPDPDPVYWKLLTAYNEMQSPQMNKVVEFMRPRFTAEGEPSYNVRAFYDYDLSELVRASAAGSGSDVWDTGVWDTAIWGGGQDKFQELEGGSGMGRTVAIAMSGATTLSATLLDIGIMYRSAVGAKGML